MSFNIGGKTWKPLTATEHADLIIEKVNEFLQESGAKDKNGDIIQLKKNYSNALYLLALGDGHRFAENDEKLSRAINSFNIELCDDAQIENLLPIAAVTRNAGSPTTLRLTVKASKNGDCTIPKGAKAPYGSVNFIVQETAVVSAGSAQVIETVCDTIGALAILSGEVKAFDRQYANLESVENLESSIPGVAAETTNELRRRLILGDTIRYSLDGCKGALESLTGVSYARVFFNFNTKSPITLAGGVSLKPRTAYIVIHGNSEKIAETYAAYMSAPTQNSPIAAGSRSKVFMIIRAADGAGATIPAGTSVTYQEYKFVLGKEVKILAGEQQRVLFTCEKDGVITVPAGAIEKLDNDIPNVVYSVNKDIGIAGTDNPARVQEWVSASGQRVPIHFDKAGEQMIFVRVWLADGADTGTRIQNQIKRDLIISSADWTIGQSVTQLLTGKPFINCTYTNVAYTQVSLDGDTWKSIIEVGCNVIPRIADATISVEQVGL